MDGQIGDRLRDFLFGQDGIPTPIPTGTLNLHPIAALPCTPHANQTGTVANGKRRKRAMRTDSARVEQATLLESATLKKMRTAEGWRGMPNGSRGVEFVEGHVGTQHAMTFDPTKRQQPVGGGWGVTQQLSTRGWGVMKQLSVEGWGGNQQSSAGVWGGNQQSSAGGWRGTQQSSAGVWGGNQQYGAGGWGGTQQSSTGGWGGARPLIAAGWGETQQVNARGWGGHASSAGGRGAAHQSSAGGWGQPSNAVGQGETSNGLSRADPCYRSF